MSGLTKKENQEFKSLKKSINTFEREWGGVQILDNVVDAKEICVKVHQIVSDKQIVDPLVSNIMFNKKVNKNASKLTKDDIKFMMKTAETQIKAHENRLHPYLSEEQKQDIIKQ